MMESQRMLIEQYTVLAPRLPTAMAQKFGTTKEFPINKQVREQ